MYVPKPGFKFCKSGQFAEINDVSALSQSIIITLPFLRIHLHCGSILIHFYPHILPPSNSNVQKAHTRTSEKMDSILPLQKSIRSRSSLSCPIYASLTCVPFPDPACPGRAVNRLRPRPPQTCLQVCKQER